MQGTWNMISFTARFGKSFIFFKSLVTKVVVFLFTYNNWYFADILIYKIQSSASLFYYEMQYFLGSVAVSDMGDMGNRSGRQLVRAALCSTPSFPHASKWRHYIATIQTSIAAIIFKVVFVFISFLERKKEKKSFGKTTFMWTKFKNLSNKVYLQ